MAPPPSTPDKYPDPNSFDETVEVKVGRSKKSFTLHKKVICFYSGYFEKAFNGKFQEGKTGVVTLPEEDVENFDRCVAWVYTRRIAEKDQKSFLDLVTMWAFADRREIPLLMNACLDAMRDEVARSWAVPGLQLPYIYENTTPTSGLRRLAIDLTATTGDGIGLTKDSWTAEILRDMLEKVWPLDGTKPLNKKQVEKLDMCQYHQHEEGVKCPKKT